MMQHKSMLRGTALVLLLTTTACYQTLPMQAAVPAPNTRISSELTDEGTVAVSELIGAGAVEVEGVVTQANSESWTLRMLRVDHRDGRSIDWNNEIVVFPRAVFVAPMERRVDKKKSWLAAALITGGAILLASGFRLLGGEEVEDTDPVPQEILIPAGGR